MSTDISITKTKTGWARRALGTAAAAGLLLAATHAFAADPVTMAPPIQLPDTVATAADSDNASQDTVFKWTEIPQDQQVPLTRAVFDRGGYQLYDTVGETIVVPFTNQNLYVMKFGLSTNGHMYFVNQGSVPVLYLPKDGYLENAAVSGARWYPFGKDFHPDHPVFLGIAPSWDAFVGMGWYPDMTCWGGYYSNTAFVAGGIFLPTVGLFFEIGGHPYYGWHGYHAYFVGHPAPYHLGYFNRDVYRWANRPYSSLHRFGGVGRTYVAHRSFQGGGASHSFYAHRSFAGSGHTFRGATGFSGAHAGGGDRAVGGGGHSFGGGGDHGFGGGGDHGFGGGHGGFGGGHGGFGGFGGGHGGFGGDHRGR
jgi:hypothetical protein